MAGSSGNRAHRLAVLAVTVSLLSALAAGCADDPSSALKLAPRLDGTGGTVARVTVDSTVTVAMGATVQLRATAYDADGVALSGATFTWKTADGDIARVDTSGVVTGVSAGVTTVAVTSQQVSATCTVTVTSGGGVIVASVSVSPASLVLPVGGTGQLTAVAKDSAGNTLIGVSIAWSSSAPSVATVSSTGLVTAVAAGPTTITATAGGRSGSALVTDTAATAVGGWIYANDFESGTASPFFYPWTQAPADFQIVADPTGAGHGHVARFHYHRTASDAPDCNRGLDWKPGTPIGYGRTFYFKGDVYIPQPQPGMEDQNRKLLYWYKNPASSYSDFVTVGAWGNALRFEGGAVNHVVTHGNLATVNFNQWYRLDVQTTINSSPGASDGVVRIWLDGTLVFQDTAMIYMQHTGPAENFTDFVFGEQVNATLVYDEYRYWDDVAFSSYKLP